MSDSPYAIDKHYTKLGINKDGELVITDKVGNTTYVSNSQNQPGSSYTLNIRLGETSVDGGRLIDFPLPAGALQDTWDAFMFRYAAMTGEEFSFESGDPLVLDMDGDGIELSTLTAVSPRFDIDGDGFAEETGWVQRDDALLVVDKNNNGTIDDINELFGIGITSGFTELAAFDSNGNGVVNTQDTNFNELKIWRDLNQNGISEANELQSVTEAGIKAIHLNTATPSADEQDNAGNFIAATADLVFTDNTVSTVADVRFRVDNYNSTFLGDTSISAGAAALPEVKGYGVLPDLRVAMSRDDGLRQTVETILPSLNTPDMAVLRQRAFPIFETWGQGGDDPAGIAFGTDNGIDVPVFTTLDNDAETEVLDFALQTTNNVGDVYWRLASGRLVLDDEGDVIEEPTYDDILAQDIDEDGSWKVITSAEIAFLERYLGEPLHLQTAAAGSARAMAAVSNTITLIQERLDVLSLRLAVQGPLSSIFQGIEYNLENDVFVATSQAQLTPTFEALLVSAPSNPDDAVAHLENWRETMRLFIANFDRQSEGAKNTYSFITANLVAAYENEGFSTSLTAAAEALGVPADVIIEGAGNNSEINGTDEHDIFYIAAQVSATTRTLNGGLAHDAYVIGRNIGTVVIEDVEGVGETKSPDTIRFAHLNSTDVTFYRDDMDLRIEDNTSSDIITVKGHFDARIPGLGGTGNIAKDTTIEEITFADGVALTYVDIARRVPKPQLGNEVIDGTARIDFYQGGPGYDMFTDVEDGDVYRFSFGDGHDIIQEGMSNILVPSLDEILFDENITQDDIRLEREVGSNNLHIYVGNDGDIISINGQYNMTETGSFGQHWIEQVELLTFAQGGRIDLLDVLPDLQAASVTNGDDWIEGSAEADTFDGGRGNDYLSGKNGEDIYRFGYGDGHDVIDEDAFFLAVDTVQFKAGVSTDDVFFRRLYNDYGGYDLLMGLQGDNALLQITGQVAQNTLGSNYDRIEFFTFQDAPDTVWTWQDIHHRLIADEPENNAVVFGTQGADTFFNSAGNDILVGGDQNDTYHFGIGDGVDIILDKGSPATGNNNRVVFTDLNQGDVSFQYSADQKDLVISANNGEDQLIVQNTLASPSYNSDLVKEYEFADGSIHTLDDIKTQLQTQGVPSNAETITTTSSGGVLDGDVGNDWLQGNSGVDTYTFGYGYGFDFIDEINSSYTDEANVLRFTNTVSPEDVQFLRSPSHPTYYDTIVTLQGSTDVLKIFNQFGRFQDTIHTFEFADGTVWDRDDIKARLTQGGDNNDTIIGFSTDDIINGGGGQDYLSGRYGSNTYLYNLGDGLDIIDDQGVSSDQNIIRLGAGIATGGVALHRSTNHTDFSLTFDNSLDNSSMGDRLLVVNALGLGEFDRDDIHHIEFADGTIWDMDDIHQKLITPTDGDDYIVGFTTDDILTGNAGHDYLSGRGGDDTYVFNIGDGHDVIYDWNYSSNDDVDTIQFGPGIKQNSLVFRQNGDDLIVNIIGHSDWLTVREFFLSDTGRIEQFTFADGGIITHEQVADILANEGNATPVAAADSGISTLTQQPVTITAQSLLGNDQDADNHDLAILSVGEAVHGTVKLLKNGSVLFTPEEGYTGTATFSYVVTDGHGGFSDPASVAIAVTDTAPPPNSGNVINGTPGDDSLTGTEAADTINGLGGKDTLKGNAGDDTLNGGDGNDKLYGEAGNDLLIGGAGQDYLRSGSGDDEIRGGEGNDSIEYRKGNGNDIVNDGGFSRGDKIKFHHSITIDSDTIIAGRSGNDLIFYLGSVDDTLTILGQFNDATSGSAVERITFEAGADVAFTHGYLERQVTNGAQFLIEAANNATLGGVDAVAGVQFTSITEQQMGMMLA